MMIDEVLFARISESVESILEAAPGCHDFEHTMRVVHNARLIAAEEPEADFAVVELGALLHDISRPEELAAHGKVCHAQAGEKAAAVLLRDFGLADSDFATKVCGCVRKHRYRGNLAPETLEEKIVYDADKLDSVGAIGIGRAFHFAGRIGAKVHNTEEQALGSESYSDEDSAYREYLVKLRHIPERMLTETGRRIAISRAEFMHSFFDQLNAEVYGEGR